MPTPRPNEKRKDFVNRCIPIVLNEGTAQNKSQAFAVCTNMFKQKKRK